MSENLNWLDQLKNSFRGFEPEVTGDWGRMKQELDALNSGASDEMQRRMRNAQRIAAGATAIAAGMALWVMTPTLLEEDRQEDPVMLRWWMDTGWRQLRTMFPVPPPRSSHLQEMKAICVHLPVPERPIPFIVDYPALP